MSTPTSERNLIWKWVFADAKDREMKSSRLTTGPKSKGRGSDMRKEMGLEMQKEVM